MGGVCAVISLLPFCSGRLRISGRRILRAGEADASYSLQIFLPGEAFFLPAAFIFPCGCGPEKLDRKRNQV